MKSGGLHDRCPPKTSELRGLARTVTSTTSGVASWHLPKYTGPLPGGPPRSFGGPVAPAYSSAPSAQAGAAKSDPWAGQKLPKAEPPKPTSAGAAQSAAWNGWTAQPSPSAEAQWATAAGQPHRAADGGEAYPGQDSYFKGLRRTTWEMEREQSKVDAQDELNPTGQFASRVGDASGLTTKVGEGVRVPKPSLAAATEELTPLLARPKASKSKQK